LSAFSVQSTTANLLNSIIILFMSQTLFKLPETTSEGRIVNISLIGSHIIHLLMNDTVTYKRMNTHVYTSH
ncbi:hypothetical protein, partial [Staphylococcus borealis]|uniref:hypothetical protein n=1 Tax=Staphylococcus borealis TaxID=2742203 RepID=UPI0039EB824C